MVGNIINNGSHNQPIKTEFIGLTPFYDGEYVGGLRWFSRANYVEIAPLVLARSGLLSSLTEFMNVHIGTCFDAAEAGVLWDCPDGEPFMFGCSGDAFALFIPIQEATKTDWESIYAFAKDELVNTDATTTSDSEQRSEHSRSLIAMDTEPTAESSGVLLQVTPLGAVWISVGVVETGHDVRNMLEASREEITTTHQEYIEENGYTTPDATERDELTVSPIRPEDHSISQKPMRQLITEHEEYDG